MTKFNDVKTLKKDVTKIKSKIDIKTAKKIINSVIDNDNIVLIDDIIDEKIFLIDLRIKEVLSKCKYDYNHRIIFDAITHKLDEYIKDDTERIATNVLKTLNHKNIKFVKFDHIEHDLFDIVLNSEFEDKKYNFKDTFCVRLLSQILERTILDD